MFANIPSRIPGCSVLQGLGVVVVDGQLLAGAADPAELIRRLPALAGFLSTEILPPTHIFIPGVVVRGFPTKLTIHSQ